MCGESVVFEKLEIVKAQHLNKNPFNHRHDRAE